ncbi:uncharacterized protein TNCV_4812151 [Trichonephila clavipes]|nr:uncharacterized protein TNCV_4812151 [Trichonephila clavipes]
MDKTTTTYGRVHINMFVMYYKISILLTTSRLRRSSALDNVIAYPQKTGGKWKDSLTDRGIGVAFLGFWTVRTVLNPISGQVFDEGHDESGVLHSARWHDGDWMVDGIREAWLRCFVCMVNLEKFFDLAESLVTDL